jgi:hypothetical protein|tara:strand:- start:448 stop:825 length:378 start_codon:yes stop_codon:yes gene_type:complete
MLQLNEDNFLLYAVKNYHNPGSMGMSDLENDLKKFKYVKRLLNRYQKTGEISERLVLNHLVVLYNVFGDATTDMLFYKLDREYWSDLKTYLVYLHRMPLETLVSPGIKETDIPLNEELIQVLRAL